MTTEQVKERFVIPKDINLWELIGDLSQDVLEASYNEDSIRELWRNGSLQETIEDMLKIYHWRLEHYKREDNRYADLLTAVVSLHGGWTKGWGPESSPLTEEELIMIKTFTDKHDIIVHWTEYEQDS